MKRLLTVLLLGLSMPAIAEVALPAEAIALQDQYDKDVREKVEAPSDASMQRLKESYRVTLDNAAKKTMSQGLLDATIVMQNEAKRFLESPTVPEVDEPGTDPEIVKLRGFWRAESARIAKVRATALSPLQQAYVTSLRALEKELTRKVKIDDAVAVRAKIEAFTAALGAPPAPAAPVPAPAAPLATPAPALISPASKQDELTIQAFIDGDSILHVQKDKIWWEAGKASRPGRWSSPEKPTYVNGEEWMPTWPTAARGGGGKSSTHPVALSTLALDFKVLAISSDPAADVIEKRTPPTVRLQGDRLDVSIPDPESGAKWYKFALQKRR